MDTGTNTENPRRVDTGTSTDEITQNPIRVDTGSGAERIAESNAKKTRTAASIAEVLRGRKEIDEEQALELDRFVMRLPEDCRARLVREFRLAAPIEPNKAEGLVDQPVPQKIRYVRAGPAPPQKSAVNFRKKKYDTAPARITFNTVQYRSYTWYRLRRHLRDWTPTSPVLLDH